MRFRHRSVGLVMPSVAGGLLAFLLGLTPIAFIGLALSEVGMAQELVSPKIEAIALTLQKSIARELKGGETHSYVVNLKSGQFFQAIAEQQGIDLVILLYSPSGKLIARSDSPNDRLGLEVMSVIADGDGDYRLEISSLDSKASVGKYVLKVEELRVATELDRKYVAAERAFMEAVALNSSNAQQSEERKRQALAKYLEAIPVFREQEKLYGEMWADISVGEIHSDFGEYQKAIDFYQRSVSIAKQINDRNGEAVSLNNLGTAYNYLGQYQKAIDFYQQSLIIKKQIGDRNSEATSINNLGAAYKSLGQYVKAIDFYQQSLSIQKQIGNSKGEATSLNNLGNAYNSLGQYQKAIDYYQQSLPIFKQIGNRKGEATSLNSLGFTYSSLGQYVKAIELYQQSLVISKQIGDRNGEASPLNNLGEAYNNLGQYQKAIDYYQQSLPIFKQIGNRNGEAASLNNLGLAYNNLGHYQKAIDFYQQSLIIQKQIGDRNGEAASLNNLGLSYNSLGQYQKAIDYYQKSLAISKQIGNRNGEGLLLNNLGLSYNSLGQYQKAIDFWQQSLAISKQIGNSNGEGLTLNNFGAAYNSLGQYQKAIDFWQQSLAIFKQIGDRNGEGLSLNNLGIAYSSLGQYQKAIDFWQQSLAIFKQIGNRNGEGLSLNNLGFVYESLRQYQKAVDFYQQSLVLQKQIGDRNGEATSLNNLGASYNSLGEYQKAIDFYQQSLAIFKQIGDRNGEGKSLNNLAFALNKLKQPELAILFYKQAINVIETIRKDIKGLSKEEQKSYLSTVEDTYRDLADLLLKQDRILEAQQVLDLLKVQELNDYLRRAVRSKETEQGIENLPPEQKFIALALELDDLLKRERANSINASEKARLDQLVASEQEQSKKFLTFLNSDDVKKIVAELRRTDEESIDSKAFRNLRKDILNKYPNAVLLYPLILEDRLELILITAKTTPIRRTVNIKREKLNQEITDLLISLRDLKPTEQVKTNAQQMYQSLIKPFESELAQLKIDAIIYAPDGQLRYIPLATLHDGKQWLIEKYRVNNITARSLTKFDEKAIASPKIFAGAFGNVNKAGFNGLPATLNEVKKIAERFPNTITFLESAFTKKVTENNSNSYTILHLATHGQLSTSNPEESFILFGDGTKATVADINGWGLNNVDLVVLSACQSGLGTKLGNGVEILGLGYQMQAAGARVAIASLWKVDDAGTQALMEAFYGELKKGDVSIVEALRRAQIAMINSDKQGTGSDRAGVRVVGTVPNSSTLSHPYYWSAFFAIGNGL